ncbi:hypothetical protein LMG26411_07543 [Cupriavidus numazuensis]|uniref:Uncharacterized protein n=1 Tax=Cupriavidus numazuensis TaxID=221992 RepID=A0ABM8TV41_9BURK|nr:hypothetical protein LMG26411_07543 [Cupriavidus numazuensis]
MQFDGHGRRRKRPCNGARAQSDIAVLMNNGAAAVDFGRRIVSKPGRTAFEPDLAEPHFPAPGGRRWRDPVFRRRRRARLPAALDLGLLFRLGCPNAGHFQKLPAIIARRRDLRLGDRKLARLERLLCQVQANVIQHDLFRLQQRQVRPFAVGLARTSGAAGALGTFCKRLARCRLAGRHRDRRHDHRFARGDPDIRQFQPRLLQHELEHGLRPRHPVMEFRIDRGVAELRPQLTRPPRRKPLRLQPRCFERAGQRTLAHRQLARMRERLAIGHFDRGLQLGRLVGFGTHQAIHLRIDRAHSKLARSGKRQRVFKADVSLPERDAVDGIAPSGLFCRCSGGRCRGRCRGSGFGGRSRLRHESRGEIQRAIRAAHSRDVQPLDVDTAQVRLPRERLDAVDVERELAVADERCAGERAHVQFAQRRRAGHEDVLLVLLLPETERQARVEQPVLDVCVLELRRKRHEARHIEPVEVDVQVRFARIGKRQHRAIERERRAIDVRAERRPCDDLHVMRQVGQERQRQRQVVDPHV